MKAEPFWIPGPWAGRVAIPPRPRAGDWLADEVRSWRDEGIDAVVSMLTPDEVEDLGLAAEPAESEAHGLRLLSFPVADRAVPASKLEFAGLLTDLSRQLDAGQTVAVHCRQGIGRSALVAIGLLVWSGMDPARAVETVSAARGRPVPETPDQLRWVHDLAKARPVPVPTAP
jgi:protein-tyrosine phosphatase